MTEDIAARPPAERSRQPVHVLPPKRSGGRYFLRQFSRHRLAVAGGVILILLYFMAAAAPLLAQHEPNRIFLLDRFQGPSSEHWLGTDETGRDVFARLVYGSRISLTVGLVAMVLAVIVGTTVGALAGFVGGFTDSLLMRFVDGMLTLPTFFLALLILAVFGSNLRNLILTIGLTSWAVVARVVRSETLRAKNQEHVTAARSIGASSQRILIFHVLPQGIPSIIVAATLGVAYAIIVESSLSFLGLGINPPTPSWGNMLSDAQNYIWNRPDLALYPGLLILLSVLAFNFVGDALRDTLDPEQQVGE